MTTIRPLRLAARDLAEALRTPAERLWLTWVCSIGGMGKQKLKMLSTQRLLIAIAVAGSLSCLAGDALA